MKKAFISIALAAALFCGANAQTTSTVPGWYSYQGVYDDRSADIEVVFYVVNADDETPVYVEKHNVTTSSTGTFICKLGEGTPAEDSAAAFADIDWTAANYKVQTWINGVLYGTAELGAVPYATVAEKALGIAGIDGNLNETIEELYLRDETNMEYLSQAIHSQAATDAEQNDLITYAMEQVDNANLGVTMLNNVVNNLASEVELNIDAIANLEQSVIEISPAIAGSTAAIAKLQAEVELNSDGLAEAEKAIMEISEELPGIKSMINQLNQYVEGAYEQIENVATLATTTSQIATANEAAVEEMKDQIVYATEQVDNANLAVTMLNNVVNDLATEVELNSNGLAEAEKAIAEISEEFPGIKGEINKLTQYMEGAYEQIESVQTLATTVSQIATANEEAVEALKGEVALNTEGLGIVQEDVQGLVEDNKANKAEINKLTQYMEGAYEQIESVQTLATTTSQIATANEGAIEDLKARVAELEAKLNN